MSPGGIGFHVNEVNSRNPKTTFYDFHISNIILNHLTIIKEEEKEEEQENDQVKEEQKK